MSRRTEKLTDELYEYLLSVSLREPELLRRLREETGELEDGRMQISPDQGQFMALLIELMEARNVLELGAFTGYSALVMALALPDDGQVLTCDVNRERTAIAQKYWNESGVSHKIDLHLGPAVETLEMLLSSGQAEGFDFAFIDADKASLDSYYELSLRLIRPGGLIAVDNTLWHGKVIDPQATDQDTEAIRAINAKLRVDQRVSLSVIPIGDGLALARKR
jgi:caffeoyl-CoA O-methyltransferase